MRDTIDMAREAGMDVDGNTSSWGEIITAEPAELKVFEALVRADERSVEREKTLASLMSIERKGDWITKEEAIEAIQRVED